MLLKSYSNPAHPSKRACLALLPMLASVSWMPGCDPAPTESPTPEVTPTAAPVTPTTVPATPTPAAVPGARAQVITSTAQLLQGPTTLNRVGDFMLGNDHIRVVIQQPGRVIGWGPYGGTLIDAVEVRPDGSTGPDAFGELSLFINLSHSLDAQTVQVLEDGTRTGTASILVEGKAEIMDIIHIEDAAEIYGIPLVYNPNASLPLTIRTTYSLGPEDRVVKITTEFTNTSETDIAIPVGDILDSGGDVEPYLSNPDKESYSVTLDGESYSYGWGGFGESIFALLDWQGWFGPGVSYGYFPARTEDNETNGMSVTVSGVTVTVLNTTNLLGVFTGSKREILEIPGGESRSVERYFAVGRDIGRIANTYYETFGIETGIIEGTVVEAGTGKPLPNVRLGFVKNSDLEAPVTAAYTDEAGRYSVQVPRGSYGVVAVEGFDVLQDGRPALLEPQSVSVTAGSTTTLGLELGQPGALRLEVLEGTEGFEGEPLPARVLLYGPYTLPPRAVMDIDSETAGGGAARIEWLGGQAKSFPVKPGTYTVVVTRGFEYDLQQVEGVEIRAGETTELTAILTRVVDSTGYASSDLHVHALNSPDSPVSFEDRVRTFAAEDVDILVPTDHDVLSDLRPVIEAMGLEPWMGGLPGIEATTFNMGHFNQYPLKHDPQHLAGGALDWTEPDNLPETDWEGNPLDLDLAYGAPSDRDNLTPSQIARTYDATMEGTQTAHINHPRGDLGGNFTQVGLNLAKWGTDQLTSADPYDFRLPADAVLFDPTAFNAIEVMNGTGMGGTVEVMNDWFGLLNLGVRIGATGVSDTHKRIGSYPGYARTFIRVPEDDPYLSWSDPEFQESFAQGLRSLDMSIGSGIFLNITASSADESVAQGALLKAPSGVVTLSIWAQSPDWSHFHTLEIFANTPVYANLDNLSFGSPADLGPQKTLVEVADFSVRFVPVTSSNPAGAQRKEVRVDVPMTFTEDTWIVVTARGSADQLRPSLNRGSNPFAFTNPIFVDVDGNGRFDAPGQALVMDSTLAPARLRKAPAERGYHRHAGEDEGCPHDGREFVMLKALLDAQQRAMQPHSGR